MNLLRGVSHVLAAVFNDRARFEHAWRSYIPNDPPVPFEGRWRGEWVSAANGHHGDLKCLLTQPSPGVFEASFKATYASFLSVAYRVMLKADHVGTGYYLKGEADLGMLAGGIYSYEGELSEFKFECHYRCKYDRGVFHLKSVS